MCVPHYMCVPLPCYMSVRVCTIIYTHLPFLSLPPKALSGLIQKEAQRMAQAQCKFPVLKADELRNLMEEHRLCQQMEQAELDQVSYRVHAHTHTHTHMHIYTIQMHMHTHTCTHTQCTHTCTQCTHTCTHNAHTCTHNSHTCTHNAHTHAHTIHTHAHTPAHTMHTQCTHNAHTCTHNAHTCTHNAHTHTHI